MKNKTIYHNIYLYIYTIGLINIYGTVNFAIVFVVIFGLLALALRRLENCLIRILI